MIGVNTPKGTAMGATTVTEHWPTLGVSSTRAIPPTLLSTGSVTQVPSGTIVMIVVEPSTVLVSVEF